MLRHFIFLLLASALLVFMPVASAQQTLAPDRNGEEREAPVVRRAITEEEASISRREASDLAREHHEGRVLSVRFEEGNWTVRMDDEGTVFNVVVDAVDGTIRTPEE